MLTPEQKKMRRGLMTSSVVAGAIDEDSRLSPFAAWQLIVGVNDNGAGLDAEPYCRRGDALEEPTLREGARILGCTLEPAAFVAHANGWTGDSTDALYTHQDTGEVFCAEAKTIGMGDADSWGAELTDQVPTRVLIQCHWHLIHHPGVELCYVPVLVGGWDFRFRLYKVSRDRDFEAEIFGRAKRWFDTYVVGNTPPPYTEADTDYLKERFPRDSGELLAPTPELEQAAADRIKWYERRKVCEQRQAAAENRLKGMLGDGAGFQSNLVKVSYRNHKDIEVVEWEALARSLGATELDIHQHTRRKPGPRVLRITPRK